MKYNSGFLLWEKLTWIVQVKSLKSYPNQPPVRKCTPGWVTPGWTVHPRSQIEADAKVIMDVA